MLIKLKVHPLAKHEKLCRKAEDSYEVWTKKPPERGLANAAAIAALAAELKVEAKRLFIIKGARSTAKIVKLI